MKLFESAWDGDIEGVRCSLRAGVPVDVTIFVSSMEMDVCIGYIYISWVASACIPGIYLRWLPITCDAIPNTQHM